MENERIDAVRRLVELTVPIKHGGAALKQWDWDYDGERYMLKGAHIVALLEKFICGAVSAADVELWCDLVEMRQDILYDERDEDWISDTLAFLSNPSINGPITIERARSLIREANEKSH